MLLTIWNLNVFFKFTVSHQLFPTGKQILHLYCDLTHELCYTNLSCNILKHVTNFKHNSLIIFNSNIHIFYILRSEICFVWTYNIMKYIWPNTLRSPLASSNIPLQANYLCWIHIDKKYEIWTWYLYFVLLITHAHDDWCLRVFTVWTQNNKLNVRFKIRLRTNYLWLIHFYG